MKVLIDTCVIIDVLQSREPFCKSAQKLFMLAANRQFDGYITAKSVTDIYYLSHRSTHNDKESREILSKLFELFEVADTAGIDCRRAIPSPISDFEDAVMTETAIRINADCIVTRNECDYSKAAVTVFTTDDFVKKIEEENQI